MLFSIHIDPSTIDDFSRRFAEILSRPMVDPDIRAGVENSASVYLGMMRERFSGASHGDGTWIDLKPATKLARLRASGLRYRRTKGIGKADRLNSVASIPLPILYITGGIYTSIVPNEKDNVFDETPNGIVAGTRNRVAGYHQTGGGRLPMRQILIAPDEELLTQMRSPIAAALTQAVEKTAQEIGR